MASAGPKSIWGFFKLTQYRNFACVKLRSRDLQVWTRVDPSTVACEEGFTRDVTQIGHVGTGNLEIRIQSAADLERAQPLLLRGYQGR
jgi:predicted transport protein